MTSKEFEWKSEVETAGPPGACLAVAAAVAPAQAAGRGWVLRLRQSVWLEPALRLLGASALLCVLAGIGLLATTYVKPGVRPPESASTLAGSLGSRWLKPSPTLEQAPRSARVETPAVAPAPGPRPLLEPGKGGDSPVGVTPDGKVILNVASVDDLTKLPGVGMKRAQAIVALRTKLKRFRHASDLLRVKGIGPRSLQRMLPHLVLDAP